MGMSHSTGRLLRALKRGALIVLSVVLLCSVVIRVQQHVFRNRAERLLDDIRALQLRTTTFDQARLVFRQWTRWGAHRELTGPWDGGFVTDKWFGISITAPPQPHTDYTSYQLQAQSYSIPRLPHWRTYYWSRRRFHPEYVIGGPNGCTGCLRIEAMFTQYASPADVARLMDINLSCLTRWNPCRTKADIMPAAMSQNEYDEKRNRENPHFVCDPQVIETVSRETDNAVIADVVTDRKDVYTARGAEKVFRVRLVERLKRAIFWKRGDQREVGVFPDECYFMESAGDLLNFRSGDRIILLFGNQRDELRRPISWVEVCGALPLNESNLTSVRQGIVKDNRLQ